MTAKTANPNSPWAYIREGLSSEGYLCLRFWGANFREGLFLEGLIIETVRYIKREWECFVRVSNTEKGVEKTTRSGVCFRTKLEIFYILVKHCVECLIFLLKQDIKS